MNTFETALNNYVEKLTESHREDYAKNYDNLTPPTFSLEFGKKNVRVVITTNQRSVFCFVEIETGNILKAAGWKAPAKGPRGNIFNENLPLTSGSLYRYL